ncbi:MAG: hypothetical protein KAG34_01255 [Cocleimonas sp.]|nr:hypothetical protein [Cocleimonas sp.]
MNKIIYLHIGMPKTGTSSIQVFLAKNIDALLANDTSYPELESLKIAKKGRVTSGNMGIISRALLPAFHSDFPESVDRIELLAKLENTIQTSKAKKIILSSEFLAVVPKEGLIQLYNILKKSKHQIKIIIYLRAQERFIQSVYAQRVKRHGEVEPIEKFIQQRLKENSILNYYNLLNKFSKVFGKNNLIIRVYEKEQLINSNLLDDFLDSIGLKAENIFSTNKKWVNKALGKKTIFLSRIINRYMPFPIALRLINLIERINIDQLSLESDIISCKLKNEIITTFSDSNIKLAEVYLNRSNGLLFINQKLKNKGKD